MAQQYAKLSSVDTSDTAATLFRHMGSMSRDNSSPGPMNAALNFRSNIKLPDSNDRPSNGGVAAFHRANTRRRETAYGNDEMAQEFNNDPGFKDIINQTLNVHHSYVDTGEGITRSYRKDNTHIPRTTYRTPMQRYLGVRDDELKANFM